MDSKQIALRILASLYPDAKPSEVRTIIDEAMKKDVNKDDVSLWESLVSQTNEDKKEEPRVIERHYYHNDYWRPWYTTTDHVDITCGGAITGTCSNSIQSNALSSSTTYSSTGNNC